MPKPLVQFLLRWYKTQQLSIHWIGRTSEHFEVTNGVCQGGVLSPVLFAVYLDSLLDSLCSSGRGCFGGNHFCGALCYADDLIILAPSPDALRKMLAQSEAYAVSHDIRFIVSKTQLICFHHSPCTDQSRFLFCGHILPLSDTVLHLGNTLHFNLSDNPDIQAKVMAFCAKLTLFCFGLNPDSHVKMKLFQAYCLSFNGSSLWRLDCPELNSLSVAFNNVIRSIWNMPQRSHTLVVHCLGSTGGIHNNIFSRFCMMFNACISHASPLIHSVFTVSAQPCNSNFIGYNFLYGHTHCKQYKHGYIVCSQLIREIHSDKFYIPGFSTDELDIIVSTSSTMQL